MTKKVDYTPCYGCDFDRYCDECEWGVIKNKKDLNGNETGWTYISKLDGIKPLGRYDIVAGGSLRRGVTGNIIISMRCGIAPKIQMIRERF
jgi:NAD-dependent dihydropyrimidine dehydrogenase PreA subunit